MSNSSSACAAVIALCVGIFVPAPLFASDPPPFPDFTFKMEKPPKPGTRKLITIQIEPQPEPEVVTPTVEAESPAPSETVTSRYNWFWSAVATEMGADPGLRLRTAFDTLDKGPDGDSVAGPRLQTLQSIAAENGVDILQATIGTDVSPALVLAVIAVESGGRSNAESGKGALGLMQLMPDTATRFGVTDSLSSSQNIRGGVAYLDWLLGEFDGDAVLALAGYNAGEGAVKRHGGVPPFAETRDYVPKVLAAFEVARGLCKTRPELITDACALQLASN